MLDDLVIFDPCIVINPRCACRAKVMGILFSMISAWWKKWQKCKSYNSSFAAFATWRKKCKSSLCRFCHLVAKIQISWGIRFPSSGKEGAI